MTDRLDMLSGDTEDVAFYVSLQRYLDGDMSVAEHSQFVEQLRTDDLRRRAMVDYLWNTHLISESLDVENADQVGHAVRDEQPNEGARDPAREACPTPHKSLLNWASRNPKVPAIAIAATVLIAALVVMGLTPVRQWMAGGSKNDDGERQLEDPKSGEFVAILNNAHQAKWLDGTQPRLKDPRLKVGRRLAIASGLIEVKYYTGAKVVIEGPAEFFVGRMKDEGGRRKEKGGESEGHPSSFILHPSNAGFLRFGSLVARVEGEEAQGFTIDTPSARIRDLGTEFGVEVDRNGEAEVAVLSGEVDVIREASTGVAAESVRLIKDQGAFVLASGGAIQVRRSADAQLLASMKNRLMAIRDEPSADVSGVAARLLGHWKFDDEAGTTATDSSIQDFDADQTVAAGNWIDGKAGGAYRLPRFALDARESKILALGGRRYVTLSAWVTASSVTDKFQGIAGFENINDSQDVYSLKLAKDDRVVWTVDGSSSITSPDTLTNYAAATDDGWVHLVGVFAQGNASMLYVNGVPVAKGLATNPIEDDRSTFAIGSYQGNEKFTFKGSIDDVQVYYGALDSEDVKYLFDNPGSAIRATVSPERDSDSDNSRENSAVDNSEGGSNIDTQDQDTAEN